VWLQRTAAHTRRPELGGGTLRKLAWLFLLATVAVGLVATVPAAALPANPWTGRWQGQDAITNVITLTQTGSQISGTGPCPGIPGSVTYGATASADNTTANFAYMSSDCPGVGGTFSGTLAASGQSIGGSGMTQNGTGFSFSWTYLGGGTEPRSTPPPPPPSPPPAQGCPTAASPWTGYWLVDGGGVLEVVQSGASVRGVLSGGESNLAFSGTVSGNTLTGTATGSTLSEPVSVSLTSPRTFAGTLGVNGSPFKAQLQGCGGGSPPNLQTTVPNPQTLTNGPTTLVAPGTISLRSLKRSKCVLVKVSSIRPARILVSIFSGRRSIRLFGQKLVVFFAPGRKQPCIPVPFRAHTFNVRTPLNVALGYTAGARPQRGGPKPKPVIKPIRLVP
jgi:hypothetical protein